MTFLLIVTFVVFGIIAHQRDKYSNYKSTGSGYEVLFRTAQKPHLLLQQPNHLKSQRHTQRKLPPYINL